MQTETLKKVSDTTLEAETVISVDINATGKLRKLLIKWGVLPKRRVFILKPIYLGSLLRISKLLLEINFSVPKKSDLDTGVYMQANFQAAADHTESIAHILAIGIRNSSAPVDKKLVKFILDNFTTREMMGVLILVIRQMDLTSFMTSIISVKGLNVVAQQDASVLNAEVNGMSL